MKNKERHTQIDRQADRQKERYRYSQKGIKSQRQQTKDYTETERQTDKI
jgi:hypothetical protein